MKLTPAFWAFCAVYTVALFTLAGWLAATVSPWCLLVLVLGISPSISKE